MNQGNFVSKTTPKTAKKSASKQTPMMRQYLQAKAEFPDCIMLFRLGDFYEMFFEDAEIASKILDIALTSRSKGKDAYPMCGVPHFSAKAYIAKLVEAGHKVAVCDQVEDAKQAKGIVKRKVTRVVSPGMITEPEDLDSRESNFIGAIEAAESGEAGLGFAFLDVSTADFRMTQVGNQTALIDEIARVLPRELVIPQPLADSELHARIKKQFKGLFLRIAETRDMPVEISDSVEGDLFSPHMDGSANNQNSPAGLQAARTVFYYANTLLPGSLEHIRRLVPYQVSDHMIVDEYTRTNLELVATLMEGKRRGSLLGLMDDTRTPMGARMLSQWVLYPLSSPTEISKRLDAVEQLVDDTVLRSDLVEHLSGIRDLERLLAKVSVGQATPRDLGGLRNSLQSLPDWAALFPFELDRPLSNLIGEIDLLDDLFLELDKTLVDEPPVDPHEGGSIRQGYNSELDEMIQMASSGRTFIAQLEHQERERTGISSLKIKFNRVFGYFLEVTKPNLHLVPDNYRRKQTTANAERFETDELKEQEVKILRAQEDSITLEKQIIASLIERVCLAAGRILQVARQVATSDVLACLAKLAAASGYCRPMVDESETIDIREGRHPVVEKYLEDERFVPNDIKVDCDNEQILIITGPNMAGKSTTIRQAALITIMAQMGSFVPASYARIGVVDRIFTRIGAADNLARGLSTFMVEMTETANILSNATRRSLLILDEIGRGTSTFDGLSIAWSVAEYLHDRIGARALFATHYHQLTDLTLTKHRVANYTISVKEWKEQIIFLRTLVKGICNRSYGIQVGKLAGLPQEVIARARQILANLEGEGYDEIGVPRLSRSGQAQEPVPGQLHLFVQPKTRSPIEEELANLDLDGVTPLEALQILHKLKGDE
jgi:DNA mismatch repair protein MutS